jgi:hypothetical protein
MPGKRERRKQGSGIRRPAGMMGKERFRIRRSDSPQVRNGIRCDGTSTPGFSALCSLLSVLCSLFSVPCSLFSAPRPSRGPRLSASKVGVPVTRGGGPESNQRMLYSIPRLPCGARSRCPSQLVYPTKHQALPGDPEFRPKSQPRLLGDLAKLYGGTVRP